MTERSVLVSIASGSRGVVVAGLVAADYETAWREGLVAAQQALDVFSARGLADLHLAKPQFDHLAIYGEGHAQVLRLVGISTLNVAIGPVQVQVFDSDGNPRPQQLPAPVWHESMRYYRQAQLSDDLFESFRSLWLAFENLLDSLAPQTRGERENAWLKRALARADAAVQLKPFLPPGSTGDPVDDAYRYFYDDARTHLFHAKASRKPLLPYEATGTNLLVARHRQLTRLYLELLEHMTKVRRPSGALALGGFDKMMEALEVDATAQVTDDPRPVDPDAERINPDGGFVAEAVTRREPRLEVPFLRVFLARLSGPAVASVRHPRKTALLSQGKLVSGGSVEGDLEISDLGALEVQMGVRVRQASQPKAFAEL